jgi:hypothetical protein
MSYTGVSKNLLTNEITNWKFQYLEINNNKILGYGVSLFNNLEYFFFLFGTPTKLHKIHFKDNKFINILNYKIKDMSQDKIILYNEIANATITKN